MMVAGPLMIEHRLIEKNGKYYLYYPNIICAGQKTQ